MIAVAHQPFTPILSVDLPDDVTRVLRIRSAALTLRTKHGVPDYLETSLSCVVLARLRAAAAAGESVTRFEHDGRELDADGLAGLNSYLRTARTMGRMRLPFDRIAGNELSTRYTWAAFCAHLGLCFR